MESIFPMDVPMESIFPMDVKLLREATRPEHEATEAGVPLMGPGLTREAYVAVLRRFHTIICAWDSFAAAVAPAPWQALVRDRQRCGSLEADLRFFGADPQNRSPDIALQQRLRGLVETGGDAEEHDARFLGAMYVVEGSTLGGQFIAKHLEESLGLEKGEGDRFFRGYGEQTMPRWREFQQALLAVPDAQADALIDAAKGMFRLFGEVIQSA